MPSSQQLVWACIICYRVPLSALLPLLEVLGDQADTVLLLDNSPEWEGGLAQVSGPHVKYIPLSHNMGTAGALNHAWRLAIDAGATSMISFDQDSLPHRGMVSHMLNALETLKQTAPSIGAIGPSRVDPRSGKTMRVRKPVAYLRVHRRSDASQAVQVDHLITSGCLITTDVFQRVGPFREDLFLDYVDIEWSLRARALGYPLFLDTGTAMDHTIGDSIISIAGRTLPVHQALRSYLLLRNHLLLWHSSSAGICWLLGDLRQVILKSLALLVLRPKRLERLRWMAKGIWHGIRGKGGAP